MTPKLFLACCLLALAAGGCLVSEQIGEPEGWGTSKLPSADVTIHFDTTFNKALMFVRSAALAAFGYWIFSAWGMKPSTVLVGGALIAASVWFVVKDFPKLQSYRLEVAPEGLALQVPPELDTLIEWRSIEGLELEGFSYARVGGGTSGPMPFGRPQAGVELPDWRTMKVTLVGGETHTILLEELSIEHREIFAKALIKRADLVELD